MQKIYTSKVEIYTGAMIFILAVLLPSRFAAKYYAYKLPRTNILHIYPRGFRLKFFAFLK